MIGAIEARNRTIRYDENSLESKLKKIEKLILKGVAKGEFYYCFDEDEIFIDKKLSDKLKELGYKLETYNSYNKSIYKISW